MEPNTNMATGNDLSRNQKIIYRAVIIVWLILFVMMITLIVAFDLQRAEKFFTENTNLHYQQASDRVHVTESILEGFAAMMSVNHEPDRERIRDYARKILERYPHIFMFEIVEKVPHDRIESFTDYYRKNLYPDFKVKGFSYETDRQWQEIKTVPYHLPIVFMGPFPEQSREVMGLDLSSNVFFLQVLEESELLNTPVSSDPFKLIEGDLAYVIHRPIPVSDTRVQPSYRNSGAVGEFAVLVVRPTPYLTGNTIHYPACVNCYTSPTTAKQIHRDTCTCMRHQRLAGWNQKYSHACIKAWSWIPSVSPLYYSSSISWAGKSSVGESSL